MRFLSTLPALLLAMLGAVLLPACSAAEDDPTPDYRYRLTVEVDTPEGLRSGSSVIEVETRVNSANSIPNPDGLTRRARGEAVAVELPDGQVLFALLRSEDNVDWAKSITFTLAPEGSGESGDPFQERFDNMLAMGGAIELPETLGDYNRNLTRTSGRPMLVTFRDPADPTSVERVDPDDLAASFGEGVSLKRITVEMTDDPVTRGIEERLGWLAGHIGTLVYRPRDLPIGEMPLEHRLNSSDFMRRSSS